MDQIIRDFLDHEEKRLDDNPNTLRNRKTGLRAFNEWLGETGKDPLEIGPLSIEEFAAWLTSEAGRGISEPTADTYVDQVSKLYQYSEKRIGEEYGDVDWFDNPVPDADTDLNTRESKMSKELHDDKGYVAMSPEQFEKFAKHIPAPTSRNQLLFQIMWDCGLRPEEVVAIELDHVDRDTREIDIRSEKTHLNRTVFYGEKVAQMLRIYLEAGERARFNAAERSPYLFPSIRNEQLTVSRMRGAFKEAIEEAEIENGGIYEDANGNERRKLSLYSLRHGFAERMVDRGVDLETLRDVMGHQDVSTTQIYVNPDKETRRERIQSALDGD